MVDKKQKKQYVKYSSIVIKVPTQLLKEGHLKKTLTKKLNAPSHSKGVASLHLKADKTINKPVIEQSGELMYKPKRKAPVKKATKKPEKKAIKSPVKKAKKLPSGINTKNIVEGKRQHKKIEERTELTSAEKAEIAGLSGAEIGELFRRKIATSGRRR